MLCDEDCRTAGFGKTERPVGWEGDGELARMTASEALRKGKPAGTDRLRPQSLSHSFTLDFVCAFQYEDEANAFYKALQWRLEKFGLQLSPEKTRVIPFTRTDKTGANRFDFLSFEFRWGKDREGKDHLKRRTSRKKLRNSLHAFTQWCRENRNLRLGVLFLKLNQKLRGYLNYYAITGNSIGIQEFFDKATRILLKWLNRRSQRRSFNWQGFKDLLDHFNVPRPRITRHLTKKTPVAYLA
jgi:hypothetical protein